jgi:hypothetical protein
VPDTVSRPHPEYVAARTVLLDALDALVVHRPAVVVVGAQAVYLRTGSAGLTVAPYTTDGDLALDPTLLGDHPLLEAAMERCGFHLLRRGDAGIEPGTWIGRTEVDGRTFHVPVDLIVPEAVLAGGGRRGARLPPHGKRAAKRTHGLEAALVDQSLMTLRGLAAGDRRTVDVRVAGVAALLVAKVHKIRDRVAEARTARLRAKDAGDVLRLIRATPVARMADRLQPLSRDPIAGQVTREALTSLGDLFGAPASRGVALAVDAVELDLPADQVEAQLTGYVRELRRRLRLAGQQG